MDLVAQALADAKQVKAAALANAKLTLEETFQPTLQRMISNRISEEEGDEEMEDDIDIDVNIDGEEEGGVGMGSFEDEPEEDLEGEEEMPMEGEDMDIELESLIRELDGEEEMMEGDEEDYMSEEYDELDEEFEDDEMMEGEEESWSDPIEENEEMDDELTEALNALFEEEGLGDDLDMGPNKEDGSVFTENPPSGPQFLESRKLRNENKKLKKDLNEAYRAVSTLKRTLNEVNLLNAKLMFTTKTFKQFALTENQQQRILDTFDRANSVREVKLVYTTICESLNRKTNRISESFASKSIQAVNPKKKSTDIVNESLVDKFQRLANIKRLDD